MTEAVEHQRRRFSTEEVLRMVESGVLRPDESVELLEGDLVVVSPQGPQHAARIVALQEIIMRVYGVGRVRVQLPIDASPDGLPEPDLAVVRHPTDRYAARHPTGADVILVIEVAHTSQELDREKVPTYARIGVPVYWLLDIEARRLEVRTGPLADGAYASTRVLGEAEEAELPEASGERVVVADLLG